MAIPPELMASASEVTKLSKLSVYRGGQPKRAFWRTRSRPSSQILWRETHWSVTDRGIASLDGPHFLNGLRLTDKDVIDLAAGGDFDHPDDFAEAWRSAARIFRNCRRTDLMPIFEFEANSKRMLRASRSHARESENSGKQQCLNSRRV